MRSDGKKLQSSDVHGCEACGDWNFVTADASQTSCFSFDGLRYLYIAERK